MNLIALGKLLHEKIGGSRMQDLERLYLHKQLVKLLLWQRKNSQYT